MGVVNVTPDSFSDGGSWLDPRQGHRARPGTGQPGRRHHRRRRRVDPAGRAARAGGRGTAAACCRSSRRWPRAGMPRQHRHHAGRGREQRARGGRRHGQRRQRRPGGPGDGRGGRRRWRAVRRHALARAQRRHVRARRLRRRRRRGRAELRRRVQALVGRRRGPGPADPRSRPRLRQAARAQLEAAGQPGPHRSAPGYAEPFPVLVAASRKGFLGRLLAGPDGQPRSFARSDDATIAADGAGRRGWRVVRPGARRARQRWTPCGSRRGGGRSAWQARADAGPDLDRRPAGARPPRRLRARADGWPGLRRRRRAVARHCPAAAAATTSA